MSGTDDKTTIATLTAQLAEARAMVGAVIEKAAEMLDSKASDEEAISSRYRGGSNPHHEHKALATFHRDNAASIRALDPDATAALSSIKREAEDAGIKIGLRAGAKVAREEAWPEDGTYQPHESNIEDAERGTVEVIEYAILALTPDEARKLGEDE